MKIVELIRLEENYNFGTFGVLKINKEVFCVTLELPDKLNASDISSIPAQQYICKRVYSPSRKCEVFEIMNVPGRTHAQMHAGNTVKDILGCIILAQYFGKLKGDRAVLNSGATFKKFMEIMNGINEFHLTISEKY